jgi:hypothetical protein
MKQREIYGREREDPIVGGSVQWRPEVRFSAEPRAIFGVIELGFPVGR